MMMPTWFLILVLVVVFFIIKKFIYIKDFKRQDIDEEEKKQ